jgi:hypothetical protein
MKRISLGTVFLVAGAFCSGLISHLLYQRWTAPLPGNRVYAVGFSPLPSPAPKQADIPLLQARDVERIKGFAGNQARVRGRVYRVGHSGKSDTYFLNFGPSRASFTAVIFASALQAFEKKGFHPKTLEGREVEIEGEIKDHPKYGLEMILEDPAQIKVVD